MNASSFHANLHYTAYVRGSKEPIEKYALRRPLNEDPLREEGTMPRKMLVPGQRGCLGRLRVGGNRDFLTIQLDYRIVTKSVRMKNTGGLV